MKYLENPTICLVFGLYEVQRWLKHTPAKEIRYNEKKTFREEGSFFAAGPSGFGRFSLSMYIFRQ